MILRSIREAIPPSIRTLIEKIACLAIIILFLWSGGLGCLICCASAAIEARCASDDAISDPLAFTLPATPQEPCAEHSCCKRSENNQGKEALSRPFDVKPCCLHSDQPAVLAVLPQPVDDRAIAPEIVVQSILFQTESHSPPVTTSAPVLSRGSTYLRCCVLLI